MQPLRYNHKGFTLVEVVLVLMIIAVCAMIAAPKIANFTRGRVLPNTAVQLATTARWCRVKALEEGRRYRLNLDPVMGKYWVTKEDDVSMEYTDVTDELGLETTLPDGITMSTDIVADGDGTYITFEPGGRSDVGTIALTNDQRELNVTCETPAGLYRVFDPVTQGVLK